MNPLIIWVPSPLGLRPSGLENAPDALRRAGLHERLGSSDVVRIDVPPYCDVCDPGTAILNPQGIAKVAREVAGCHGCRARRRPLSRPAGRGLQHCARTEARTAPPGAIWPCLPSRHADFLHPDDEPNGEVASLDLALATGRGPDVLADLEGLRPLVRDDGVALVGYRVLDDNDHFLDEHVRSTAITVVDLSEVREAGTGRALEKVMATVTKPDHEGFWVHLDVDVLDDSLMPAVDYRYPGGITWAEAAQILGGLLASDRACGLEVTIFNPRLDSDGSCRFSFPTAYSQRPWHRDGTCAIRVRMRRPGLRLCPRCGRGRRASAGGEVAHDVHLLVSQVPSPLGRVAGSRWSATRWSTPRVGRTRRRRRQARS
jgi:arginase